MAFGRPKEVYLSSSTLFICRSEDTQGRISLLVCAMQILHPVTHMLLHNSNGFSKIGISKAH